MFKLDLRDGVKGVHARLKELVDSMPILGDDNAMHFDDYKQWFVTSHAAELQNCRFLSS